MLLQLWCWRRFLRVPWPARRFNQSILEEISPEYSLEGLMLKLKHQMVASIWRPDAKNWLIWKDPDAGKDWRQEGKETREDEMVGWHHQLDGHEVSASSGSWWWTRKPGLLKSMGLQSQTLLSDWTEVTVKFNTCSVWQIANKQADACMHTHTLHSYKIDMWNLTLFVSIELNVTDLESILDLLLKSCHIH